VSNNDQRSAKGHRCFFAAPQSTARQILDASVACGAVRFRHSAIENWTSATGDRDQASAPMSRSLANRLDRHLYRQDVGSRRNAANPR
jgi:hypothetical protein